MEESPQPTGDRSSTVPPSGRVAHRGSRPSVPVHAFAEAGTPTPLETAIVKAGSTMPPAWEGAEAPQSRTTTEAPPPGESTSPSMPLCEEVAHELARATATAPAPRAHAEGEETLLGVGFDGASALSAEQTYLDARVPHALLSPQVGSAPQPEPTPPVDVDEERTITAAALARDDDTVMGVPSALLFGLARAPGPEAAPHAGPGVPIAHDEQTITANTAEAVRLVRQTLRSDAPKANASPPPPAPLPPVRSRAPSNADEATALGAEVEPELALRLAALDAKGVGSDAERSIEDVNVVFAKLDASAAALDEEAPVIQRRNSIAVRERRARFRTYVQWAVVAALIVCVLALGKHIFAGLASAADPQPLPAAAAP